MCDNDKNKSQALEALCDILEEAVRTGADAIELGYADSGLEVCYMFGNTGLGDVIVDHELEYGIIAALVEKAGLDNRPCGTMRIDLGGEEHSIVVEEYESFGESTFRLTLTMEKGAG